MVKAAGSYRLTRYNAMKFGIQHEGPVPCLGLKRCTQRYCDERDVPPSDGSPCPWEAEHARRLDAEFRDRFGLLDILPDVDGFEELATEFVNIYLQRGRAMTRMNRGWERHSDTGRLRPDAFEEFDLAELYLDRLARREQRLMQKVNEGLDRMRERHKRVGGNTQALELLALGLSARGAVANRELPPDDFIDSPN